MSNHRLTRDYFEGRVVRFFGAHGQLWHTDRDAIADLHRPIEVGDLWENEE